MSGKFLSTLKKAATVAGDVLTTKGDILSRSSSALARLGVGTDGKVLTAKASESTGLSWETANPNTTKGDLSGFSDEIARIPIGTNFNVLTAKSGAALGLAWSPSSTSVLTAAGDLLYASGANTLARLAKGNDNEVLTMNGSNINWEAASGGTNTFYLQNGFPATTSTNDLFFGFGDVDMGSNENEHQVEITDAFDVKRITCFVKTNSRGSTLTLSFRDDGADKGTVSITNATTGQFDSGALTQSVAADSIINMKINTGTGTGTLECRYILIKCNIS